MLKNVFKNKYKKQVLIALFTMHCEIKVYLKTRNVINQFLKNSFLKTNKNN